MSKKSALDYATATREELITKIKNQQWNIASLEEANRRALAECGRYADHLRAISKVVKGVADTAERVNRGFSSPEDR